MSISLARIEEEGPFIDPVFRGTPRFPSHRFGDPHGLELDFKTERLNPIRSFKGRGAEYFTHRHRENTPLVEGAGAVALAATTVYRERFAGRRLANVVSGSHRRGEHRWDITSA